VRTNCPIPAEYFTNNNIEQWKLDREFQEEYVQPTEAQKLLKNDETSILTFIEDFPDMLIESTGCNGIPLAYIVREDEAVPHHSTDPMYLTEGSRYRSAREELIVRASISFRLTLTSIIAEWSESCWTLSKDIKTSKSGSRTL
jgi:hypothetical protein